MRIDSDTEINPAIQCTQGDGFERMTNSRAATTLLNRFKTNTTAMAALRSLLGSSKTITQMTDDQVIAGVAKRLVSGSLLISRRGVASRWNEYDSQIQTEVGIYN